MKIPRVCDPALLLRIAADASRRPKIRALAATRMKEPLGDAAITVIERWLDKDKPLPLQLIAVAMLRGKSGRASSLLKIATDRQRMSWRGNLRLRDLDRLQYPDRFPGPLRTVQRW